MRPASVLDLPSPPVRPRPGWYRRRGANVPIFRFFEDRERGDLPWDDAWVLGLYRKFKSMHWNFIRFCIGFPPESWYRIADEEGFLIQDEYPVWLLGNQAIPDSDPKLPPDPVSAEYLIPEFTDWMRERWNHPCVVIWDAQNESITRETGKAIRAVRHLDLSNRPWENGWGEPQAVTDRAGRSANLRSGQAGFHRSVWRGRSLF